LPYRRFPGSEDDALSADGLIAPLQPVEVVMNTLAAARELWPAAW
jgi:hypothetical protein